MIVCVECGEEKKHHGNGLCGTCYQRNYQRHYREAHRKRAATLQQCWREKCPDYFHSYRRRQGKHCLDCGAPITDSAIHCLACNARGHKKLSPTCAQCGKPISPRHTFCNGHKGLRGEQNPAWRGGLSLQRRYRLIRINGRRIAEHRLLMEQLLGRILSSQEIVHHKDGDKMNNSIDNLMLYCSRSAHSKMHMGEAT